MDNNSVSVAELAKRVGVVNSVIYHHINRGHIESFKDGRFRRIPQESADDFARRHAAGEFQPGSLRDPNHPIHSMDREWAKRKTSDRVGFFLRLPEEVDAWLRDNIEEGNRTGFIIEAIEAAIKDRGNGQAT